MRQPPEEARNQWNASTYDDAHSFVYEYGEDVVDLLDPQPDERILDLGCGTGHLTQQIAEAGATAVGLDQSAEMVEAARERFPDCEFVHADARGFTVDEPFDAVFSNAALHWIPEQDAVLDSVVDALRPGGRFVAELGGHGNIAAIVSATHAELAARGYERPMPWYFPTVGEYASRLEAHGLEVRYTRLFDRPTELDGEDGLATWLEGFGDSLLAGLSEADQQSVIEGVEARLREEYFFEGSWTADYRRLRVVAVGVDG
ncbi:MAG: methyltransferase domain-containing protein [Halohasta sp.]